MLCQLAFTDACNNKVTFNTSDLDAVGASKEICDLGLLQAAPSIVSHGRSVYYHFLHLSIQEMLTAIHISQMQSREQISIFDSLFKEICFGTVLQFYAAITKLQVSRPFLSLVPRFCAQSQQVLTIYLWKSFKKNSKTLLLSLLNCLCEAQNTALCKFVGEQLRELSKKIDNVGIELNLSGVSLLPQDCFSIGYFLASIAISYHKGKFTVDLGACSIGNIGIKILMQNFCRNLNLSSEIISQLDMILDNNFITESGVSCIAEVLQSTKAIRKLDLCFNTIRDKGLQYIAEALITNSSLIELDLYGCSLRITQEN